MSADGVNRIDVLHMLQEERRTQNTLRSLRKETADSLHRMNEEVAESEKREAATAAFLDLIWPRWRKATGGGEEFHPSESDLAADHQREREAYGLSAATAVRASGPSVCPDSSVTAPVVSGGTDSQLEEGNRQ